MKLLITGAFQYNEEQIEYLKSLSYDIKYIKDERIPITDDVSDIEAVVCNSLFLYTPIEKFTSLRIIQLTSAGLDRVPLDYINEHSITLYNARGVYSVPMAEFAVCGILQLLKKSRFFASNQSCKKWVKNRELTELNGSTACIIGAGSVGCEVAKRLKAFDVKVIGVDLYPRSDELFDDIFPLNELNRCLSVSDINILTLPLNEDNRGLFDKTRFKNMKQGSIFVNIARGGLVNENDLISALKNNDIGGAVLDVFCEEPLNEKSELWEFENVIITPHNSFVSNKNSNRLFNLIADNLSKYK